MQAQPIPRRLSATNIRHHALKRPSLRPLRRNPSTQTSASTSASQQAPQSSPNDDPSKERDRYTSDGNTTYRKRLDNGSSKRSLPLPPIMDPVALAARERWTEPKQPAPRRQDLTPFQRKLYANPYAHALCTPVRADRTSAVLPAFFYLALHTTPHPTTSEPWVVPLELSAAAEPSRKSTPAPNTTAEPPQSNPRGKSGGGDGKGKGKGKPPSPTAYVALRRQHVHNLGNVGKKDRWMYSINARVQVKMRASTGRGWDDDDDDGDAAADADAGGGDADGGRGRGRGRGAMEWRHGRRQLPPQHMRWREDMDDLVLSLLQRAAFRHLHYAFSKPRGGGVIARILPASTPGENETTLADRLAGMPSADDDGVVGAVLFLRRVTSAAVRDAARRVDEALHAGDAAVDQLVKARDTARRSLKEKPPPRLQGGWDVGGPRVRPTVLYAPLEYASVRYNAAVAKGVGEGEEGGQEEERVEREVPVYDLVELLGEERLRELVGGTAWEGEAAVVLREKETTIKTHHALMQLQDYVIESV